MKKSIFLAVIIYVLAFTVNAQNRTMYIMKDGVVTGKYNIKHHVDSVVFYQPAISEPFTDSRDGHVYQTVTIGTQVWMAENLAYLPSVVGPGTGSSKTRYYYVYGYDGTDVSEAKATSNYTTYGVLYNWPAAMDRVASSTANPSGVQGVCPTGWHLPSDDEWKQLFSYVGQAYGGALKETGTTHWNNPNISATNEFGFTALPGGFRGNGGAFDYIGGTVYWWSTTQYEAPFVWCPFMDNDHSIVYRYYFAKESGFSVRCVKD